MSTHARVSVVSAAYCPPASSFLFLSFSLESYCLTLEFLICLSPDLLLSLRPGEIWCFWKFSVFLPFVFCFTRLLFSGISQSVC